MSEQTPVMSPSIGALASALAKAQEHIDGAKKDSKNPFFKSQYADLSSVWDACHKHLSANGLSVVQTSEDTPTGKVVINTFLLHSSGEWIRSTLSVPTKANDPQAVGSALTYARRYALSAMVGVCPIDDDAELAQGRAKTTPTANPSASSKKSQIVKLMSQCGLQPTVPTAEAWNHAVQSALNMELIEENFDAIIEALEKQLTPPTT